MSINRARALLLGLPLIDLILIIHAEVSAGRLSDTDSFTSLTADVFATLCFWISAYLVARTVVIPGGRRSRHLTRRLLLTLVWLLAAALVLYHLLLWSFIVLNGHPPSPETVLFLVDNLSQIPPHILQTAPWLTLGGVLVAMAGAWLMLWLTGIVNPDLSRTERWRGVAHAAILLAAWYVIAGAGSFAAPSHVYLERDPDANRSARAKAIIAQLPARPNSAAIRLANAPKVPVIVILVESLRHDLLETDPAAVPFFRQMYKEATGFDRAYATASHSNLSDLAFWYSQYPLRAPSKEGFPPDAPWRGLSLFDVFKQHGYRTAYISSQNEQWGGMINWLRIPTVDYFFDSEVHKGETWENFDDAAGLGGLISRGMVKAGKVEDSETLVEATKWIESLGGERGFFLGMNLQNTHFSYVVSPGATQPFQPSDLGFRAVYYSWPREYRDNVRNRYLNSVHDVDQLLSGFAEYLKSRGLWDDSIVAVIGDNGEAFHEHGFGNHSGPMYEEVVRTLAFIKLPRSQAVSGARIGHPVSHIDIAASIVDAAGLPRPWSFQGRSVFSGDCSTRPVFMYSNAIVRQYGVVSWPWKYLRTTYPDEREELYDLESDPHETNDVASRRLIEVQRLQETLANWMSVQREYYSGSYYTTRSPPDFCRGTGGTLQGPNVAAANAR